MSNRDLSAVMPERFPAAVVTAPGKVEIIDIPRYEMSDYDCVVKMEACSICAATDTHLIDGCFPKAWCSPPPFVLGHESAGRIVAVGPKVRTFKAGQLVVRPWWLPPGWKQDGIGTAWGGFSTWASVRDTRAESADTGKPAEAHWLEALPMPEMPARDVTLFVTLRDCMSCLLQMGAKAGDRIAVFGTGGNGLAFTRFATLLGATVVVVGSSSRFDKARKLGASACIDYKAKDVPAAVREAFGGQGADISIDAVGDAKVIPLATGSLKVGGKFFIFGIPGDLQYPCNLWAGPSRFTVETKACAEWQAHGHVLTCYQTGQINPDDFTDGCLPLDKINDAFAAIRRKEAVKLTITMP